MTWQRVGGSFRDPSGFVFRRAGALYRQVNRPGQRDFEAFEASGLYGELADAGLIVRHRRVDPALAAGPDAFAVLEIEPLPFISYPYEWCFSQLKDAALLTLEIQRRALRHDLTVRDASAYNVQFRGGQPVFIDTLSFGRYTPGAPWEAYRQFCQHFVAPLALMSTRDPRCGGLLRNHLDGVPLDLASRLIGVRSRLRLGLLFHLHLHAGAQRRYADASVAQATRGRRLSKRALVSLVDGLEATIAGLSCPRERTAWADYSTAHNYSPAALAAKQALVRDFLARIRPDSVWDLGANAGAFSRIARERARFVVAFDLDHAAVEQNYRDTRARGERGLLPLLLDLTNPSPAQGWAHGERLSLADRGPADALLALALIHHLAIGNNVPLEDIAAFLARLGRHAIVEFVPKSDGQVRRLLRNRDDIFPAYTREGFEAAFGGPFRVLAAEPIADSERWLYLMARRSGDPSPPEVPPGPGDRAGARWPAERCAESAPAGDTRTKR